MKVHEFQAKAIFRKHGVPVPTGRMVTSAEDAVAAAESLGGWPVVVKAQIHAGGRGKGGGVKLAKSALEVRDIAKAMIGMNLVTHQTSPGGQKVKWLLVEEGMDIDRELYLAILLDRAQERLIIMTSPAGGMDIEEVAKNEPEKIFTEAIDPCLGLTDHQCRGLAISLGIKDGKGLRAFTSLLKNLYSVYMKEDASLAEINPLVILKDGRIVALDAKLTFDDNALMRHPDQVELRDDDEEDPLEVEASRAGLNYIKLEGNIGCMVNGAGLAMATMDLIKLAGGQPANFLDVGGGASAESVEKAVGIILKDPSVEAILINIFGGIVRCDRVARGLIEAATKLEVHVPLIIRLEGTNVEEASQLLQESGLDFRVAHGLKGAAEEVVKCIKN